MTALLAFVGAWSLRATAVILLGALVATMARKRSGACKNLIWRITLIAAAAVPMLGSVAPKVAAPVPAASKLIVETVQSRFAAPAPAEFPKPKVEVAPDKAYPERQTDWPLLTASFYLAGLGLFLLRWVVAYARIRALGRDATFYRQPPSPKRVHVKVVGDARLTVPVMYGWFSPVILLPADAQNWPEPKLQSAIAHEVAHARRGDWIIQMAATLLSSLHWFNPSFLILRSKLVSTGEEAADDAVLAGGIVPSVYAGALLEVVSNLRSPLRAGVAMVHVPEIAARLKRIVAPNCDRRPPGLHATLTTVLGMAIVAIITAGWRFTDIKAQGTVSSAQLSNGDRLELIGIEEILSGKADPGTSATSYKTQRFLVWKPDGTPVPDRGQFKTMYSEYSARYYQSEGRILCFIYHIPDPKLPKTSWVVTIPSVHHSLTLLAYGNDPVPPGETPFFPPGVGREGSWVVPANIKNTDIDIKVAYGPLRVVNDVRLTRGIEHPSVQIEMFYKQSTNVRGQQETITPVTIDVPDTVTGQDIHAKAFSKDGKELPVNSYDLQLTKVEGGPWRRKFSFVCRPEQIARVQLLARTYDRVTLKNIHLYPNKR